jgi:hypothetical protein
LYRWTKSDNPGYHYKNLWLSYRDASHVARIVFGHENEVAYRDFMKLIIPQMLGERINSNSSSGNIGGDNRHIDVTEYLHLSVIGKMLL